jgi:Domain of unknown function (DUF4412)
MRRTLPLLLLLLGAAPLAADTLLTIKSQVQGLTMAGSPDGEIRIWVAGDKLRRDDGEAASTILRLDRNKIYLVNHQDRTYSELSLPLDLQKLGASQDVLKTSVQVKPSNETKKIRSWNARRVEVDVSNAAGLKLDGTLWVSKDVEAYAALNRMAVSMAALQPGGANLARQLEQIGGFPVVQETDVEMNGSRFKTREELVSVETREAPAGLYEPPAGYAKEAAPL